MILDTNDVDDLLNGDIDVDIDGIRVVEHRPDGRLVATGRSEKVFH